MKQETRVAAVLALSAASSAAFSAGQLDQFRRETHRAADSAGAEHEYAYSVWRSPTLGDDEPAPALLFLHGLGECGTDGEAQLRVGLPPALVSDPDRWPFVVIIPQKPVHNSEWEDHQAAVLEILDAEIEREGVDPERVAITGLSQGGHGTIALASAHPDRFAGAAPVCGYVEPWNYDGARTPGITPAESPYLAEAAEALSGMAVWIFHGGRDNIVMPSESEVLFGALRDAGAEHAELTVFPDDNHNSWDSAYALPALSAWLVEHTGRGD